MTNGPPAAEKVKRIFISYIHEEESVAKAVQRLLTEVLKVSTEQVFLLGDTYLVAAGEIWLDRIQEEITRSTAVILLLSKKSVERPWVNFEAGAAWILGKPIIPACYLGLTKGTLPKPYSTYQALNLKEDMDYLIHSVAKHFGKIAPPLPPPKGLLTESEEITAARKPFDVLENAISQMQAGL